VTSMTNELQPKRVLIRFLPDPELLGSAEGNTREVAQAKRALRRELAESPQEKRSLRLRVAKRLRQLLGSQEG
jgi:hypothetical protein